MSWGDSWGTSWLDTWAITQPVITDTGGGSVMSLDIGSVRRLQLIREARREEDDVLAIVLALCL